MYHVTDVLEDISSVHPDWTEIKPSVADDKTFDGELVRLPVASFTTTLYDGDLPTMSPYPRYGIEGKSYWRVAVPFEYDKYNIYLMNDHPTQIHLLCLAKDGTDVEIILSAILMKRCLTNEHAAMYFPNGQVNEYTSTKIFVNVAFIKAIKISDEGTWDTVPRTHHSHGDLETIDTSESNTNLLYQWGFTRLHASWDAAIESFDDALETT